MSDLTINEVLMLTSAGIVVSGSMSNVFFLNKQKWETPCITSAGVAGIIRSKLLDEFPEFSEGNISESIMATCSAAFITNSLIGVVPIISLNGRALDSHLDILRFSHGLNIAC